METETDKRLETLSKRIADRWKEIIDLCDTYLSKGYNNDFFTEKKRQAQKGYQQSIDIINRECMKTGFNGYKKPKFPKKHEIL